MRVRPRGRVEGSSADRLAPPRLSAEAGLVTGRREKYWTFYAVAPGRTAFHKKLLECLATCVVDVPALAGDEKRARTVRARGACSAG